MKKLVKNQSGMTLTELLVGLLILVLVMAVVITMLMATLNAYSKANDFAEYNTLLDSVANLVVSDLSSATVVPETVNNKLLIVTGTDSIEYSVNEEGVLLRNGSQVWPKDYYRGKKVSVVCNPDLMGKTYTLAVTVFSDGGPAVSRDYAVKPLALNQY